MNQKSYFSISAVSKFSIQKKNIMSILEPLLFVSHTKTMFIHVKIRFHNGGGGDSSGELKNL